MQNPELELAQQIIEKTDMHLFLTGKAGTGKTTFLRRLVQHSKKRIIVLAPTGIAAINAGGCSIHSFFQLGFAPFIPDSQVKINFRLSKKKKRLIKNLDLIIIDEISMVRADLLDEIDAVLRVFRGCNQPFGGVQILMIGDLQQLPPVVTANDYEVLKNHYSSFYFFGSKVLNETPYFVVELKTIYRQKDQEFIEILNAIRENKVTEDLLKRLNSRYIPFFNPKAEEGYIRLVTHNRQAQEINENQMQKLPGGSITFNANITGDFPESSYPTEIDLTLKKGAQVMLIKNDPKGRYYNGSIGEIIYLTHKEIHVRLQNEETIINVEQETWQNVKFELNEKTQSIEEKPIGTFTQYPLKTAWAITIHKSQGLTFEKAIIDATDAFSHGQTYVALSRCKTIEGLVLMSPIPLHAIISDQDVTNYVNDMGSHTPTTKDIEELKKNYFVKLITQLFNFDELTIRINRLSKVMNDSLYNLFPNIVTQMAQLTTQFAQRVAAVAQLFEQQYSSIIEQSQDYEKDLFLQERVTKGATYFKEELQAIITFTNNLNIPIDNKEIAKRVHTAIDNIKEQLNEKDELLSYVAKNGFSTLGYQRTLSILMGKEPEETQTKKTKRVRSENKVESSEDIQDPSLFETLRKWRKEKADEIGKPAFWILTQKTLTSIVNFAPTTLEKLALISGVGPKTIERYGEEIIHIIHNHLKER
ncbi:HRDC domain-containing protein [Falsiporphyromonas endometrii]|uniref:HRDC domain-containing protein n=1 Tax=Falsiporphyromonas endometrii TaxID=1387297 RepID=A0ABV9K9H0_9PORP